MLAIDAADSIYTLMADHVISEPLGEALPELVRLVGGDAPSDLREERDLLTTIRVMNDQFLRHSTKYDGSLHYRYPSTVVREEPDLLMLYCQPGIRCESYRGQLTAQYHSLELYWSGSLLQPDGRCGTPIGGRACTM